MTCRPARRHRRRRCAGSSCEAPPASEASRYTNCREPEHRGENPPDHSVQEQREQKEPHQTFSKQHGHGCNRPCCDSSGPVQWRRCQYQGHEPRTHQQPHEALAVCQHAFSRVGERSPDQRDTAGYPIAHRGTRRAVITRLQRAQRHIVGVAAQVLRQTPRVPKAPATRPQAVKPSPSRARCTRRGVVTREVTSENQRRACR